MRSCSITMGIVANALTARIVEATGSYGPVFGLTAVLYVTSFVAFVSLLRGEPIRLASLASWLGSGAGKVPQAQPS